MQPVQTPFINFQNYIRYPQYQQPLVDVPGTTPGKTVRQFLKEYPLLVLLLLASIGTILLTSYVTGYDAYESISERLHSSMGIWLVAVPLAVLLEEAVFRSILRLTPNRLRNIAALVVFMLVCCCYGPIQNIAGGKAGLWMVIGWGLVTYLLDLYLKRPVTFARINLFWQTHFRQVFYAVAGLYALSKIVDDIRTLTGLHLLLVPVLLLVGLLSGFYFGYIRMTYGFWYAVAVHSLLLLASLALEMARIL